MRISNEDYFFKKKTVANVNNRFLKEVTQNHCLGLLVLDYQEIWGKPQVESMTIFTQISTALE